MSPVAFAGVYAVPYGRPRRWTLVADTEIVLEARRVGRRPRYHRGARQATTGARLDNPQCNMDQVGVEVRVLDALPDMPRPWSQLCRRCWAGSDTLVAAGLDYIRWREARKEPEYARWREARNA